MRKTPSIPTPIPPAYSSEVASFTRDQSKTGVASQSKKTNRYAINPVLGRRRGRGLSSLLGG